MSDPLSEALFFYRNVFFDFLSLAVDKAEFPLLFGILGIIFLLKKFNLEKRLNERFSKEITILHERLFLVFVALLLTIASVQFIKLTYQQERPCLSIPYIEKTECPESSTFPSTHVASSAVFVPFTIGTAFFIPSILFFILVMFSRIYLGVHYLLDVLVASAIGFTIYFIVDRMFGKNNEVRIASKSSNVLRGFFHLFFGLFIMFILMLSTLYSLYPIHITLIVLLLILITIFYLLHFVQSRKSNMLTEIMNFISIRDRFQGESAIWFIVGAMLLIGFTQDVNKSIAGLYIVTIGDVASAAFSSYPRKKSFFKNKNLLSYSAFVLSSLPSVLILGFQIVPIILIAALVESLDLKLNDNILLFVFLTLSLMLV